MSARVICSTADRDAWLAARNTGIGASEIAVLMGESDWGSNLEIYYRKTGELTEELRQPTEEMELGLEFEEIARKVVARRAGVNLAPGPSLLLQSPEHPWALATCDAITIDGEPVEVKNLSWGFDADEWSEQIPEKYMLQCQQQMLVTGAKRCLFGALLHGSRLIWEWVPRDEERIARIVRIGSEFWGHVERRDPPPSDGHPNARRALARVAKDDDALELYESEIQRQLVAFERAEMEHNAAASNAKSAKRRLDAAQDELAKLLGNHRAGFTSTGWSIRWKTTEKRGHTVKPSTIHKLEIRAPK